MDIINVLLLSIVEGVTEFIPVSSTGHLILASELLHIPQTNFTKSFEVIIQLGAILAVVVVLFQRFSRNFEVWKKVLAAFIPTAIVGLLLYKFIKEYLLGNLFVTLWALFLGGIALIAVELWHKRKNTGAKNIEDLGYKQVMWIGLCQSLSVVPGVSRSAASILGGLAFGLNRQAAVEFSFLLAIPTMFAATGLDLLKSGFSFTADEYIYLAFGLFASFVSALVVVKWFLKIVQSYDFVYFGIYRIILAILFWLFVMK